MTATYITDLGIVLTPTVEVPLYVTDVAIRPGEDPTNNRLNIIAVANGTYSPPKTSTPAVTTLTQILPPYEVLPYRAWSITVKNTSAAALTACLLYTSPDNTSWDSGTVMSATLTTLGAGLTAVAPYVFPGYRYVKVLASSGTSSSTDCWLNCQV